MCGLLCASQRVASVLVQSAYAGTVEPLLVDFEEGPDKQLGRQLLDREANGIGGAGKSPVSKAGASGLPASGGKELGFHAVVECAHFSRNMGLMRGKSQPLTAGIIMMIATIYVIISSTNRPDTANIQSIVGK
jgi:hypothetical protein